MHLRSNSTLHNGRDLHEDTKEIMRLLKPEIAMSIDKNLQYCQNVQHHQQSYTKGSWTKRFILWSILLIQFGFILCFWLMQLSLNDKLHETPVRKQELKDNRINFIQSKPVKASKKLKSRKYNFLEVKRFQWPSRELNFQNDFMLHQNDFNLSETDQVMFERDSLWCFKEGTANDTTLKSIRNDASPWQETCECLPEWHGRDCGQPEVIWRALLTTKTPIKLKDPTREEAHRLVYLLEGNFLNLDLMELQVKAVAKVVDYFIVYIKRNDINVKDFRATKFRLNQLLPLKNFFLYRCKLPSYGNCSSAEAYRLFRQQQLPTNAIKPSDLLILTDDKTILGHRALNFLKYYSSSNMLPVIQLRLRFNVYGFYWQHPKQTHLSGLISSFQNFDNSEPNPSLLQTQNFMQHQQNPCFVIGDLNHFAGWFCKYCQTVDEIINELQLSQSSSSALIALPAVSSAFSNSMENTVVFPYDKKHSSPIDALYVQKLISKGTYLADGKSQLQKVHRNTDKYYAPLYATEHSWKYGPLIINIYESLEDFLDSDDEEEMF